MHEKLKELEKKIVEGANAWVDKCGLEGIDCEELGEITDMLKDLSEARYYDSIVDAMGVPDEYENERMGYDNWRYASGRFAPKGRGTRSGYTAPMVPKDLTEWPHEVMGYDGRSSDMRTIGTQSRSDGQYSTNGSNSRMGYPINSGQYGRYYDEYQNRKRSYSANQTADNRRAMEESADKHIDEVIETTKEIWRDVDKPMREKMREKLVDLINNDMA